MTFEYIDEKTSLARPQRDHLQEIMKRMAPDNLQLFIEPYIRLNGDPEWLDTLGQSGVTRLGNLSEIPAAIRTEAFYRFLEQFSQSKRQLVEQIVELLPLSPATEREWKERRKKVSAELLSEVDSYVEASNELTKDARRQWRFYVNALGDQAGWYLQLAHPDIIPSTMRSGFVLPDAQIDEASYIPLETAIVQMLQAICGGNENKAKLMCNTHWCREYLNLSVPVLIRLSNSLPKEERERYSKMALHVGNRKFFYLLNWDRSSILSIRARCGEIGEALVTMDRMADWGFVEPDSPAAEGARQRAALRAAAEAVRQEQERQMEEKKASRRSAKPAEVSPREIRSAIEKMPEYHKNAPLLTDAEWCKTHIGIVEPVLLSETEAIRLRRKQQSAGQALKYSVCSMSINRMVYMVRRMNPQEYEAMIAAFEALKKQL